MSGITIFTISKARIISDDCNRDEVYLNEPEDRWSYEVDVIDYEADTACVKIIANDGEVFFM